MANPATLADVLRQTGYSQDGTLAAPATDSPMTKALSEHIKTLPQQLATNQAALDSAIGSWNKTDFGTGLPNPNYRPEAIAELTQLMPNIGGLTAWHGTPHKIQGAFDISKVGTGEGAQAYGHGMYFAETPEVAKTYMPKFEEKQIENAIFAANGDVNKAIQKAQLESISIAGNKNVPLSTKQEVFNLVDGLKKVKAGEPLTQGNLYKVDIPDEYIPNMLYWDKPLSKQPKVVQDALAKIDKDLYHPSGSDYDPEELGQMVYSRLKAINAAKGSVEADKAASEMLNNMGVKGIRYLDAGSRGKEGTSNFVVFEPSTVKILEENGKPLTRKELIEKQVKDLKD